LIAQAKAKDANLGAELEREFRTLANRRSFGLNFERHRPESVELPGRPIRKGDKVRILPPRGEIKKGDQRLWMVRAIQRDGGKRLADLVTIYEADEDRQVVAADDLIVVAEFKDYIYPGLISTGKVTRGGDKPFHTVINGENFHALEALTFTHRSKIDAIYIDPPYNTGARDWKYNNDYVEGDDLYRHSKWLAMMERRLLLARELLNPASSVLIVTIDEKEYLRLGLLLEQVFPEARIQMITIVINPGGSQRADSFGRVEEYAFFIMLGSAAPGLSSDNMLGESEKSNRPQPWGNMMRRGTESSRSDRAGMFYPVYVDAKTNTVLGAGDPLPLGVSKDSVEPPEGVLLSWPIRTNGSDGRWMIGPDACRSLAKQGFVKAGRKRAPVDGGPVINYLSAGTIAAISRGEATIICRNEMTGAAEVDISATSARETARTVWNRSAHNASAHGTALLKCLIPDRKFPFPKSLYAVEDALRFFVTNKPDAVILDFFAGSGTTAHAVMRLNRQDGGRRQCISVTNNEVGPDEHKRLRGDGLRPGDPDWEQLGICDYITKPRIKAAITGRTPDGEPIKGDYKFTEEFPMDEGFEENAEFFTLTYETPVAVSHNRAFERIAPLLWMRAGSEGRRIEKLPDAGWEVADSYGLLTDLDQAAPFCAALAERGSGIRVAYIVTDDERRFQAVAQHLPDGSEPVRLYESYLTNFRFSMGR
jgi:adenine-specific DNA-methyltransferase